MQRIRKGQVELLVFEGIPVFHGFTTRRGGVSTGGYDSLNLGRHTADDPVRIEENYRRLFDAFDIDARQVASTRQTHSDHIRAVDTLDGSFVYEDTDGLMTDRPGVTLMTYYADCTPLFFFDPTRRVIAAAHAGWHGTYLRIASKMVQALGKRYGSDPADLHVGIGPNISLTAYEVGEDFRGAFRKDPFFDDYFHRMPSGRWHFDMVGANRELLLDSGVKPDRIEESGHCTYRETEDFFSHRRQGSESGRMSGLIRL